MYRSVGFYNQIASVCVSEKKNGPIHIKITARKRATITELDVTALSVSGPKNKTPQVIKKIFFLKQKKEKKELYT